MERVLPKTGDIVDIHLDPTIGGEKGKTRPCLVLVGSGHPWKIIIVVPVTEDKGKRAGKLFVPIPHNVTTGLLKPSCIDCFQIRCVSERRSKKRIGKAPSDVLKLVRTHLANLLDIGEEHVK